MTELMREIRGLIEALNKTTPLAVTALALLLGVLLVLTLLIIGGWLRWTS